MRATTEENTTTISLEEPSLRPSSSSTSSSALPSTKDWVDKWDALWDKLLLSLPFLKSKECTLSKCVFVQELEESLQKPLANLSEEKFSFSLHRLIGKLMTSPHELTKEEADKIAIRYKNSFYNFLADHLRSGFLSTQHFLEKASAFENKFETFQTLSSHLKTKTLPKQESAPVPIQVHVIVCRGGGGHISAGEEIERILHKKREWILWKKKLTYVEYQVRIIYPLDEFLYPIDFLQRLTAKKRSGEGIYNFLLRKGWHRATFLYTKVGHWFMRRSLDNIAYYFDHYFTSPSTTAPQLVISTIPFLNHGFLKAAEKHRVPLLVVPTDLDSSTFLNGLTKKPISYPHFKFALPSEDATLRLKVITKSLLKAEHLEILGFPSRKASRIVRDKQTLLQLCKKHALLPGYPTLTVIAGAQGGKNLLSHAKAVAKTVIAKGSDKQKIQVNLCTGRNQNLYDKIVSWLETEKAMPLQNHPASKTGVQTFEMPNGIVFHLRGYVKEIIEIMACSHIIITKTGTCTVMEGVELAMSTVGSGQRPYLLLDNTKHSSAHYLWWEAANIPFVEQAGIGEAFSDSSELSTLIPRILEKEGLPLKKAPLFDFELGLCKTVSSMLSQLEA